MKTIMKTRSLSFILLLFVAVSCSQTQGDGNAGMAAQVKEYQVIALKPQSVTLDKKYPTTLEGQQTVEIRPRVAGYIEEILVDEGAYVKKGQILFRLNAPDIRAKVRSAEAQIKVAEAEIETARINLEKTKPLVAKDIVSSFDLQSAEVTLLSREAQLAQAKANLENAKANLEYTVVTSPTDGIIGNFPFREGSLVSSASTQPLTSISNTSSMYAYFSMNEKEFLNLIHPLEGSNLQQKLSLLPQVSLLMADNSVFEHTGTIETASGLVDIQTGSVNLRATFPNPASLLRSGSSGKVSLPQHLNEAMVIPQKAAYELQGKHFVYVVGEENKVYSTEIEVLAGNLKNSYVVISGLKPGDQVVIEGASGLRNETPIKPKLVEPEKMEVNSLSQNQVQ